MNNVYTDKEYIKQTIKVLKDQLDDLKMIDVYNKDKHSKEISTIEEQIKKINYK